MQYAGVHWPQLNCHNCQEIKVHLRVTDFVYSQHVIGRPLAQMPLKWSRSRDFKSKEGGVRVCGDAVQRYFWCGFAEIFILTCGIAVLQN